MKPLAQGLTAGEHGAVLTRKHLTVGAPSIPI